MFKVSDCVEVYSNGYRFKFDRDLRNGPVTPWTHPGTPSLYGWTIPLNEAAVLWSQAIARSMVQRRL